MSLANPEERTRLVTLTSQMMAAFIVDELTNRREHLVAEQAFAEAVLDNRLRDLAICICGSNWWSDHCGRMVWQ